MDAIAYEFNKITMKGCIYIFTITPTGPKKAKQFDVMAMFEEARKTAQNRGQSSSKGNFNINGVAMLKLYTGSTYSALVIS